MCSSKHRGGKEWSGRSKFFKMSLGGLFLGALLVMILWNAVMPDLFGLPRLGYWQAFAVLFLSRLLWGSHQAPPWDQHGPNGRWREKLAAKMREHCDQPQGKSSEEQEKDERFKRGFTSGKWDVNVIDVEEEEEKKDDDANKGDQGEEK